MTQIIKYLCDKCGKEFDKSNMPPWYPDLCPEHMEEYQLNMRSWSTYTAPKSDIKVWL